MNIQNILEELTSIDDTQEQIAFYNDMVAEYPALSDIGYISFNELNSNFSCIDKKSIGSYNIYGLGDYGKLWVIDKHYINRKFKVRETAYLDLNIIDRINRYIEGKKVPDENNFLKFMNYLKNNKVNVAIDTSIFERMTTLFSKKDEYKESLENYCRYLSDTKLDKNTCKITVSPKQEKWVEEILNLNKDDKKFADIKKMYNLIYCMIVAAFFLKTKYKDKNMRIIKLTDYCLNTLNVYMAPELYTLFLFLKEEDNTGVFNKLQESKIKKRYSTFHNVAWDLLQVRLMEEKQLIDQSGISLDLPYFVTNDKGLYNYLKLNPRRGIFVMPSGINRSVFTHSDNDILNMIPSSRLKKELRLEGNLRKQRLSTVDFENEKNKMDQKVKKMLDLDA